jgi:hypothetical protein
MAPVEGLQTMSDNGLTRLLQVYWPWQTLLELALRSLLVCERDYLIRDNTVLPKRFATTIEGLALIFSRQERKPVMVYPSYFWSG